MTIRSQNIRAKHADSGKTDSGAIDLIMVQQTIHEMLMAADRSDWPECRSFFTDRLLLDHDGEPRQELSTEDVIASWAALFRRFTFTRHMVTNHVVEIDGDQANCTSYVAVVHSIQTSAVRATYKQQGNYRHQLRREGVRWLITAISYQKLFDEGDKGIMKGL
jgi:SnoaL-like protein